MKRYFIIVAGIAMMLALAPRVYPAHAQEEFPCTPTANGNGTATCTITVKDIQEVIPPSEGGANPCTGVLGTLTLTYNAVFHVAINDNGDWATGTTTGTFVFTPVDTAQPSYTGHFTTGFGESDNRQNNVEHATVTLHGIGSDGSRLTLHDTMHMSVSASGITLSFDKLRCG